MAKETHYEGIDGRDTDSSMPNEYRRAVGASMNSDAEFPQFADAYDGLPAAEERRVWFEDENHEMVRAENHVALAHPEMDGSAALFEIHGSRYTNVEPDDILGPFVAVLNKRRDELGDVFGTVRAYRHGGEVHADTFFGDIRIAEPQSDEEPYILGFNWGWDYFAGRRLYMEPVIFDERNGAVMRDLSDPRKRTHSGNAASAVADWWDEGFETLSTVTDTVFQVLLDAREYEIEFRSLPFGPEEFYDSLGFPDHYTQEAKERLGTRTGSVSAHTLYRTMVETLADEFGGKPSTLSRHMVKANRILYNPPAAVSDVIESVERELREKNQATVDGKSAADSLRERREEMGEIIDAFGRNENRIRVAMTEAEKLRDTEVTG